MEKKDRESGHDINVDLVIQSIVTDALTQLTKLWRTFGLTEDEQLQQKKILVATVEKSCQMRVSNWRKEVDRAEDRVTELKTEVQIIKKHFHGNETAGSYIQPLNRSCRGALRDRLAALENEFKFLDSVQTKSVDFPTVKLMVVFLTMQVLTSRMAEINSLRDHLRQMDKKLGTTSVLVH
ncbi:Hypothetical protein PHPALM_17701 [Phytophthora palmivora]|uniref:Uncharacterized protein n=1 Tax=Phytophthora palmivora TaxID=4796 RepID=A0A2P4XLK1_9STRA|nr:Hypothetical protein PHPALM_17701 [Phytophthora palmivora]